MPRRAEITPRPSIGPAPRVALVTQIVNRSCSTARSHLAEQIVYDALALVEEQSGKPAVEALEQAIKTITPVLEVKSRRVGGANYQVPVEVPQRRARTLAVRWLVQSPVTAARRACTRSSPARSSTR